MARPTKPEMAAEITAMLQALDEFSDVESMEFGGQRLPRAKMHQALRAYLSAVDRTQAALIAHRICVAEERAALATARPIVLRLRLFLRTRIGPHSPQLQNYGVRPLRKGKKTVTVKLQAAEKALATRKLRNTMGKKQRRAIKG